jgi:hypothetical protein
MVTVMIWDANEMCNDFYFTKMIYFIHNLQLGIFVKNNKAISHRSLLKIFLNPFLRRFLGIAIGSKVQDLKFIKYVIIKQKSDILKFNFHVDFDYDYKI